MFMVVIENRKENPLIDIFVKTWLFFYSYYFYIKNKFLWWYY